MKGFTVINAFNKASSYLNQAHRLKEEFEQLGVTLDIIKNDGSLVSLEDGKVKTALDGYDFCIYLDKDKYLSAILEKVGVRLFNTHEAIRVCDDKMRTYIELIGKNIAMPKTIAAPLCYTDGARSLEATLKSIKDELGFPLVAKTCYGSLGAGVSLIKDFEELKECDNAHLHVPHLYQEFLVGGSDIRVIVIGGKAIAAMKRINEKDFRSNVELGGTGYKYELGKKEKLLAEEVARLLKLDYCGVDILIKDGEPYICEVNSNAFFGGIEKVTEINVAKAYAEYIVKKCKRRIV